MNNTFIHLIAFSLFAGSVAAAEPTTDIHNAVNAYYELPLNLAVEAAQEAIHHCERNGYHVTATIVDASGLIKLQAKGDASAVHTKDSSYGKAYTITSMARVFDIRTTGEFAKRLTALKAKKPELAAVADIPGILPLAGGVAIHAHGKVIAGIGIGGAPGGDKDEVCAWAGVNKIKDRLPQ